MPERLSSPNACDRRGLSTSKGLGHDSLQGVPFFDPALRLCFYIKAYGVMLVLLIVVCYAVGWEEGGGAS